MKFKKGDIISAIPDKDGNKETKYQISYKLKHVYGLVVLGFNHHFIPNKIKFIDEHFQIDIIEMKKLVFKKELDNITDENCI